MYNLLKELNIEIEAPLPIYVESDPVVILDDGCFIGNKIKSHKWAGPGFIKAYDPTCRFCQAKVKPINKMARKASQQGYAIYVIDVTDNPIFADAFNVNSYPTFFKVLPDGTIGEEIEGDLNVLENELP